MTNVAENAITRSISHNEIVTIEWSHEAHEYLLVRCEDHVETGKYDSEEFWGTDDDGNDWRVHLRDARCDE